MANIKNSLLNNSDSIDSIRNSINSFGASLRAANSASSVVIKEFNASNKAKKACYTYET